MTGTVVSSTKYNGANGGTTSPAIDTTGAGLIVVFMDWGQAGPNPVPPTDNKGNTYQFLNSTFQSQTFGQLWYALVPTVGSGHTFSCGAGQTGNFPSMYILAISSDVPGSINYDSGKHSEANTDGSGATSLAPGSLTASATNSIYITGLTDVATGAMSIGSGFTLGPNTIHTPNVNFGGGIAHKSVGAATATNPTWSWSSNIVDAASAVMAVFLEGVTLPFAANEMVASSIVALDTGQNYATITRMGTWNTAHATPITIERQVYKSDGTTLIQDWTAISSPSISAGGSWSVSAVYLEGDGFRDRWRYKDVGGAVIDTTSVLTNAWGVGPVFHEAGQSNLAHAVDSITGSPTCHAAFRVFDKNAGAWVAALGNGYCALSNAYCTPLEGTGWGGTNKPLGIARGGIGGAGWITDGGGLVPYYYTGGFWTDTVPGSPFAKWKSSYDSLSGNTKISGVIYDGGSSDAVAGVSGVNILAGIRQVRTNINTYTGRTSANLPCFILTNNTINDGATSDAMWDNLIQSCLTFSRDTNCFLSGVALDLTLEDAYHLIPDVAGYERLYRRFAQTLLKWRGFANFDGARFYISEAKRPPGLKNVYIHCASDSDVTLKDSSGGIVGSGLTDINLSIDNFSTLLTITATSFYHGRWIKVTYSNTIQDSDTLKVRYLEGVPTATNLVYDGKNPGGDTKGRVLQPTLGSIVAALGVPNIPYQTYVRRRR